MFGSFSEGKIHGLEYAIDTLNMKTKKEALEILTNTLAQLKLINFDESGFLKQNKE